VASGTCRTHPLNLGGHDNVGYRYAAPIWNLRQRLVVVPQPVRGNQRVLSHRLEVSQPHSRKRMRADRVGNVIFEISIPRVEEAVDFDVSLTVERWTQQGHTSRGSRGQR
jgi:hypothetical protein